MIATVNAKLLTTKQAAVMLGISVSTLRQARSNFAFGTKAESKKLLPRALYCDDKPFYELEAVLECLKTRAKHNSIAVKRSVLRAGEAWEIK